MYTIDSLLAGNWALFKNSLLHLILPAVTLGYFSTTGTADAGLYENGEPVEGSASGSPNTRGAILELNWLPRRDWRVVLQYTAYDRFNGARNDYDGFGRNARDNNALFLLGWFMF